MPIDQAMESIMTRDSVAAESDRFAIPFDQAADELGLAESDYFDGLDS